MKRRIAVAGLLSILAGCNADPVSTQDPPTIPIPPISAYRLIGTVRDETNTPIRGASVKLTDVAQREQVVLSDSAGHYEFAALTGVFTVAVRHRNYQDVVVYLFISTDRVLDVKMVPVEPETIFELGKEYDFVVPASNAPCDPVHWDAHAPCTKIRFRAPRSGTLTVELTWASEGEVDFTIMSEGDSYLAYGNGDGQPLTATVPVLNGNYYVIWVHSYYGAATFKVRADIVP
jgi:hypothetical protein